MENAKQNATVVDGTEFVGIPVTYEKRMSAKGRPYDVIFADLGYRRVALTFDRSSISELLGVSLSNLFNIPVDTVRSLGSLKV